MAMIDLDAPAGNLIDLDSYDPPKPENVGLFGTIWGGAKNTARSVGGTVDLYQGDNEELMQGAQAQRDQKRDSRLEAFMSEIANWKREQQNAGIEPGWWDTAKELGSAALNNPAGAGLMVAEQLPNSAVALGSGWAGMKAGAIGGGAVGTAFGGIGAVPGAVAGGVLGGIAGLFAANTVLETGGKALDEAAQGPLSDEQRSDIIGQGVRKGAVITGVDVATLGLTNALTGSAARAVGRAAESATIKTLTEAGVDVADKAAVMAARNNQEIVSAVREAQDAAVAAVDTVARRATTNGAGLALETFGEGLGEYLGEYAATGQLDKMEALIEAFSSVGQSAGEVAITHTWNRDSKKSSTWGNVEPGIPEQIPADMPASTPAAPDWAEPATSLDAAASSIGETIADDAIAEFNAGVSSTAATAQDAIQAASIPVSLPENTPLNPQIPATEQIQPDNGPVLADQSGLPPVGGLSVGTDGIVSLFAGQDGNGLSRTKAKLEAQRLNAKNTDPTVTYAAEEHPGLGGAWAVFGRKTPSMADVVPAAPIEPLSEPAINQEAPVAVPNAPVQDQTLLQGVTSNNVETTPTPRRTRLLPVSDDRLKDEQVAQELMRMAQASGWETAGGKLVRDTDGNASGRTPWIPRETWYANLPEKLDNANTVAAVNKAIAGEPMTAKERRVVMSMLDMAQEHTQPVPPDAIDLENQAEREAIIAEATAALDEVSDDHIAALIDATFNTEPTRGVLTDEEIDQAFGLASAPASSDSTQETDAQGTDEGDSGAGPQARDAGGQAEAANAGLEAIRPHVETLIKRKGSTKHRNSLDVMIERLKQIMRNGPGENDIRSLKSRAKLFKDEVDIVDTINQIVAEIKAAKSEPAAPQQDATLSSYTNQEVLQREAANERAKKEAEKEPPAKNVTADQVDMFATQGSLFTSNREEPVATPQVKEPAESLTKDAGKESQGDKNFYYVNGQFGMKSDGSFTKEKRFWMTFTRETALDMNARNVKPYGATRLGVFTGTVSGETLRAGKETISVPDLIAESTPVGKNDAGEALYDNKRGRFRVRHDSQERYGPDGYADFGGDLAPVEGERTAESDPKQSAIAAIKSSDMTPGEKLNTIAAVNKGDVAPEDVKDVVGQAAQESTDEEAPKEPAGKIEDFGEKIGGARKDVWQSYKKTLADAAEVDIQAEPLSKSWPAPDYDSLLEAGADPWAVAFMHAARDEVPTKPSKSWRLKGWVEQVKILRDFATGLADGAVSVERTREELAKMNSLRAIAGRIELYLAVGHAKSLRGVSVSSGSYGIYNGVEYSPPKIIWAVEQKAKATAFSNWPRELAHGDTKEEAIANFKAKYESLEINKPASKDVKFEIYSTSGEPGYRIGKKIGRNPILLTDTFKTIKEAREYLRDHQTELVEKLEKAKEIPNVRRDTNEPRVGEDMRGGQDVTPQMFAEAFGFKGIEFGNWVEQKKRQKDLNEAYDALMDMAAIIGVNPKALSLNGELGLAFGARGTGGIDPAKAHYEADYVVINLTKKDGAGSIGHEWFHALDNYFSRMRGKKADFMTEALDVSLASRGSEFIANTDVRKEMIEAFGGVARAINQTSLKARSAKLDAKRNKEYWTTGLEMAARAYESYLISKLQDQNASNDYLANIVSHETWQAAEKMGFELDDSYPYPTAGEVPEIRAAFDNFFQTIETKETDKGLALFSKPGFNQDPSADEAKAVQNAIEGKTPLEALRFISENDPQPERREIAKRVIAQMKRLQLHGRKFTLKVSHVGDRVPQSLLYSRGITWTSFDSNTTDIWLQGSDVTGLVGMSYETVLHEMLHAVTQAAIYVGNRKVSQGTKVAKDTADLIAVTNAIIHHFNARVKDVGVDGLSDIEKAVFVGHNAIRDPNEVVSWALTNKAMQDYLESIPYKNGNLWTKFVEAIRNLLGLAPKADTALSEVLRISDELLNAPVNEVTQMMNTLHPPMVINQQEGLLNEMVAYHGSPHDFDQFSTEHIGSGEGAQAYGWGLYFAGKKEVAEWYKEKLSSRELPAGFVNPSGEWAYKKDNYGYERWVNGSVWIGHAGRTGIWYVNVDKNGRDLKAREIFNPNDQWVSSKQFDSLENAKAFADGLSQKPGRLYTVDLAPQEDEYLLWDKPLSEQSEKVKAAIKTLPLMDGVNDRAKSIYVGASLYRRIEATLGQGGEDAKSMRDALGLNEEEAYRANAQKLASRLLQTVGIRGIKYLDGASRGQGEGNYNYVIFDDADVNITAKFSRTNTSDSGMALRDLEAHIANITKGYKNLPHVVPLQSVSDAPAEVQQAIDDGGARNDVEGLYFNGKIYLFADHLNAERAEHVLLNHELAHYGLRGLFGSELDPVLHRIYLTNADVRAKANDLKTKLGIKDNVTATEEVLVDMAQEELVNLKGWQKLVMTIRDWLRKHGWTRIPDAIDKALSAAYKDKQAMDVAHMVNQARAYAKNGKKTRNPLTGVRFGKDATWKDVIAAWRTIGSDMDVFQNPTPDSFDMTEAAREIDPGMQAFEDEPDQDERNDAKVERKWLVKMPDGTLAKVYENRQGEVWINAANLAEGISGGTKLYLLVGSYAEANGKVFIGDPAGLSDVAMLRRTENLLSLALRFGRTDFIMPHEYQMNPDEKLDSVLKDVVRPINWVVGDDENNLGELLKTSYANTVGLYPEIKHVTYNFDKQRFEHDDGRVFDDEQFDDLRLRGNGAIRQRGLAKILSSREPGGSGGKAKDQSPIGSATLKRAAITNTVARASRGGRGRDLLAEIGGVVSRGLKQGPLDGILYSRQSALPIDTEQPPAPPTRQTPLGLSDGSSGNNASWDATAPGTLDNLIYRMQDKHVDLKRVQEAIKAKRGELRDSVNAYAKEELFHGRTAKRVDEFLENELTPLLTDMRLRNVSQEELGEYLWARHAKEANAHIAQVNPEMPDGGSGMTDQEADDYMAALAPEKRKAYEALAAKVDGITRNTRHLLVQYGLMSANDLAVWEDAYKHYIPLNREDMDTMTHGTGTGQGYSIRGPESKRRTGSSRAVVDILGNIANQRDRAIVRGEKNRVALALYGLAKENPNPDFWKTDKPPVLRVVETVDGVDTVVERIDPLYKSRDNVVMVKIPDGKGGVAEHSIVFNERNERAMRMASSIKNLDGSQLGELLGTTAKITRYFASINTQYNPIFGVVNLVRDVQGALINLTNTPLAGKQAKILGDTMSILGGAFRKGGRDFSGKWKTLADEFAEMGGQTGYRDMFRTGQERTEALQHALDPDWWTKTKWGKALTANGYLEKPSTLLVDKGVRPVLDWLSDYNSVMENSVRLAAYAEAKAAGLSKDQAASLAKNLTVNFNRKGEIALQAGALYAFFNASVQGMARMMGALNGPAGKRIIYGGMLVGAAQALMLAAAGFDDDEPPEFVRERNLILPIGGKKYLTLPMPLGFNVLPNIGRIATEFLLSGGEKPADRIASLMGVLADATNPLGGSAPLAQIISPTVTDPIVALAMNEDWTGKPIAREDFNSLNPTPGFTRHKDAASGPAKWAAEAINTLTGGNKYKPGIASPTPDQIEYLIGQVTGGLGREIGKAATTAESLTTGDDLPTYKVPLLGRFYGSSEGQASQGNRFYANLKDINEHEAVVKGLREDRKAREAFDYIRENPEARLIKQANAAERAVQKLRREKRALLESGASRDRVKLIDERITKEMRRLNERVDSIKHGYKSAA